MYQKQKFPSHYLTRRIAAGATLRSRTPVFAGAWGGASTSRKPPNPQTRKSEGFRMCLNTCIACEEYQEFLITKSIRDY